MHVGKGEGRAPGSGLQQLGPGGPPARIMRAAGASFHIRPFAFATKLTIRDSAGVWLPPRRLFPQASEAVSRTLNYVVIVASLCPTSLFF